jgi:hypothetical protein
MMSLRKNTLSTLLVLGATATLALSASACSGGGDDDDDGNTPLPNPYDSCAIWFETFSGAAGEVDDLYLIFAPVESWLTGTVNFGPSLSDPFGVLYADRQNDGGIAVGTAGSFSVTAASNSLQQPIEMNDNDNNTYAVITTAGISAATGGQGSFTGILNDWEDCLSSGSGDPEDCIFDGGTVAMTVTSAGNPRNITLGADVASAAGVSFAMCIDIDDFFGGFAPQTRQDIIRKFGEMHAVKPQAK